LFVSLPEIFAPNLFFCNALVNCTQVVIYPFLPKSVLLTIQKLLFYNCEFVLHTKITIC
jgi:hypothetical protein